MLSAVKKAIPITTNAYDEELLDLIEAAKADLAAAGITEAKAHDTDDPLIRRAIKTFAKANFGAPDNYQQLKASYDEQKAQLQGDADYAKWGNDDGES